jgi:hypothetical protein
MDANAYNSKLPTFLHRSAEQIQAETERQERPRRDLALKGARQTPAEIAYARSFEIEKAVRANLAQIEPNTEAYRQTTLQLAEVLADQGKFAEASDLAASAGDEVAAAEYADRHNALIADDDMVCECPADTVTVQTRGTRNEPITRTVEIPNEYIAGEVYSQVHERIMPLVKCGHCGFANIKTHNANTDLSLIETDRGPLPEVK